MPNSSHGEASEAGPELARECMTFHNSREPTCFPSAEELRMLRPIALLALLEAAHQGEYHASFHGFRVQALRQRFGTRFRCIRRSESLREPWEVSCRARLGGHGLPQPPCAGLSSRPEAATTDAGAMELMR